MHQQADPGDTDALPGHQYLPRAAGLRPHHGDRGAEEAEQ